MSFEVTLLREDAGVATLTINRPDKLNALNAAVVRELSLRVAELEARGTKRPSVVVLTGAGERAFAAGADLAELQGMGPEAAHRFSEAGHRLARVLEEASFVVIAAVNGVCFGGGNELALACDLIVAADTARFAQPEVERGLICGFGGTFRLPRRVGLGQARRLLYTGEVVDAARAFEIGLADYVFPASELTQRAHELARGIASKAPLALAAFKRTLLRAGEPALDLLADFEMRGFAELFATADAREGLTAFMEKRSPAFRGL
ncbi:MAG TPA: enoyl-CoA hydratase-related protein [Polyangiaceae bacterium]|nr:enoyl-CoA hydratase-related protein [Polyangiaceae bacterium]